MPVLFKAMLGYLSFLCRVFQVTPDQLGKGRRGNLPPPQGASFPRSYV
jgi:hypothetical protein